MRSANMLDRLQQFKTDVVRIMPFQQASRSEVENEAIELSLIHI